MRPSTDTIIKAMRIIANEIQTNDGVVNAAIYEAADRLGEQHELLKQWIEFAGNVQPSDAAGHDWLDMLRAKTKASIADKV